MLIVTLLEIRQQCCHMIKLRTQGFNFFFENITEILSVLKLTKAFGHAAECNLNEVYLLFQRIATCTFSNTCIDKTSLVIRCINLRMVRHHQWDGTLTTLSPKQKEVLITLTIFSQ